MYPPGQAITDPYYEIRRSQDVELVIQTPGIRCLHQCQPTTTTHTVIRTSANLAIQSFVQNVVRDAH